MNDLLQQGIAAAKAGRRAEARALLTRVLEADERSEQGWLWLSGVVDNPEEIRTCLLNVLDINPANPKAKQGLAWVEQRYGPPPAALPKAKPAPKPATVKEASAPPAAIERAVGDAYTKTTVGLKPVPAQPPVATTTAAAIPTISAPPPPPRRPSAPTERFRPPAELTIATSIAAPLPAVRPEPPTEVARREPALTRQTDRPAPAQTSMYSPIGLEGVTSVIENPCPFCGVPTTITQKRCTQCHNSLMVQAAPPATRSLALLLLGWLWRLGGIFWLLVSAVLLALLLTVGLITGPSSQAIIVVGTALLLTLFYFFVSNNLLQRERWAYFTNMLLIAATLIVALVVVSIGALFVSALANAPQPTPFTVNTSAIITILLILIVVLFVVAPILLTVLCFRDFFGPIVRFVPTFEDGDHAAHYNSGIAYRNRGMWYMAAREWEAAARKKPREANYLHALGLAYARLKRFDQARATLDQALRAAPDHPKIKESRALVDQMAAK
jgi:tetratricopeptide (TPR) repeat protein